MIKTKYYLKQLIKLIFHLFIFTTLGYGMLRTGINEINNDWFMSDFYGSMTIMVYIATHSFIGWLIEKTPLRTKQLKTRMDNIKDQTTIDKKKEKDIKEKK